MWIFKYARKLFVWAFSRWRAHQAIVGILVLVLGGIGVFRISASTPQNVAYYLLAWFAVLLLVIAPARLWHETAQLLDPSLEFIEHPDNAAMDPNYGAEYARVTVHNKSARVLNNVEVTLAELEPLPQEFMTLSVTLIPMHAGQNGHLAFSLKPFAHRTVNVASLDLNEKFVSLWHRVPSVPHPVPFGIYRVKLIASANETTPTEQWFTLEALRTKKSQKLEIRLETSMPSQLKSNRAQGSV